VKGVFHARLRAVLHRAVVIEKKSSPAELAVAMGKTPRSLRLYFELGNDKAGALDLDEAEIALSRIGSSLAEFLANVPPRELSESDQLAHRIAARKDLQPWVEGLLKIPKQQLPSALSMIAVGIRAATGIAIEQNSESQRGPTPERRTKSGPARRPRALKQR
jgi:hypothetical protein